MTRIRDVMSPAPVAVEPMTTVTRAAGLMREEDVGDVLVTYDRDLFGVLTDRDIVLRGVADGHDPDATTVGSVCSPPPVVTRGPVVKFPPARRADDGNLTTGPRTGRHDRPRGRADAPPRRPAAPGRVEHGGVPVGVVTLGDLAAADDPHSALADISRAAPGH